MLTPIDFLNDLLNPQLAFLPRALLIAITSALVCGVVGAHVVLRGMAFIGDAVMPGYVDAATVRATVLAQAAKSGK